MRVPTFVLTVFLICVLDAAILLALPFLALVHPYLILLLLMAMVYLVPFLSLGAPLSALQWQRSQGCSDLFSQLAWQMCPASLLYLALCGIAQGIPGQHDHWGVALFFIWLMVQVFRLTGGALLTTLLSLPLYWKLRHRPADRIQAGAAGLAASGGMLLLHLQLLPQLHLWLQHLPGSLSIQSDSGSNYAGTLLYLLVSSCYFLAWGASMQWWVRLPRLVSRTPYKDLTRATHEP